MTKDGLLAELREIETNLRSAEVQEFFQAQDQDVRDRFVSLRHEISVAINQLSNAELQAIADKLDELAPDLKAGVDRLKAKIQQLENAVSILKTISDVLGLVGRVVAFI